MDKRILAILILTAAMVLSGSMAIFTRGLNSAGFNALDVAFIRLFVAVVILAVIILVKFRECLKVDKRDLLYLIMFGVFKFLMDYTFNQSLEDITVGLATVLQNTAPYFVVVLSYILFRERTSKLVLISIILGTFGCVLMAGSALYKTDLDPMGIVFALCSAFCMGMYFIGSDMNERKGYSPVTFLFYVLLIAMIVSIPFADIGAIASKALEIDVIMNSLVLGVMITLIPFYIMTWSMKYLDAPTVSMISVLEVVFASFVGAFYFGEILDIQDAIGVALMVISVYIISKASMKEEEKSPVSVGNTDE